MALQRDARYPGRWTAASGGHPQGAFKNRTAPGSLDGSYIEQDWANDWDGFFSSLLNAALITPNGNVDAVGASQYYTALQTLVGHGRLLNIQTIIATGTYTKTPGTNKVVVRGAGGGGAGGGTQATTSGQCAAGGGGSAGAMGEGVYDASGFTTQSVVIGAAGVGVSGAAGGNGGSTTFGSLLTLPGGGGGGLGLATNSPPNEGGTSGALSSAPTGANVWGSPGAGGGDGFTLALVAPRYGIGGQSPFGSSKQGVASTGYGAGGSGQRALPSSGANNGYNGAPGILIVEEYS